MLFSVMRVRRVIEKNNIQGEPKRGRFGQFGDLRGGMAKKRELMILQCTDSSCYKEFTFHELLTVNCRNI